jgi:hypothetical protein
MASRYAVMRGPAHGITFSCFTLERQPDRSPQVVNSLDSYRRKVGCARRLVRNR